MFDAAEDLGDFGHGVQSSVRPGLRREGVGGRGETGEIVRKSINPAVRIETISPRSHLKREMSSISTDSTPDETLQNPPGIEALLERAAGGDTEAVAELLSQHRDRLKRMVHLRLNRRLQGRVDDSDVIQEAWIDAARKLPAYAAAPQLPFFLWLRNLVGLKLTEIHRRHLGTQMRDAELEVSLHRGALPEANSVSLAAHLLGTITTASEAAIKAETRILVQEALNGMDPIDREILALKHFEQLSTTEIAQVLGLSKAGAGSRYLRAIKRLRAVLSQIPGFQGF